MHYNLKQLRSADDIRQTVGTLLSDTELFFASPIILDIFFNNPYFELWNIKGDDTNTLVVKKLRTGEIRILFKVISNNAIEYLKDYFNPPFMCYNLLTINPEQSNQVSTEEVIINIDKLLELSDSRIRHKYQTAVSKNASISVIPYSANDVDALKKFFHSWDEEKLAQNEKFKSGIYHDELFVERYSHEEGIFGVCAYGNGNIVGYSIGLNDYACIGAYGKCNRGYHQLGLQVFIERVKQAQLLGYKELNIATVNNDFKKQFLPFARTITEYGYEIFRAPTFQTKTPDGYTYMLFSQ
jgi:hypothetical protein